MESVLRGRKRKWKKNGGFTLLEMVIAAALVSIFFTMAAFVVPVWYRAYSKAVNLNYARQIAASVMGTVEQQVRFANDVEILEDGGIQRLTGKNQMVRFQIPMENTVCMIEGLVYDEKFFMRNQMTLGFELSSDRSVCTVTVRILDENGELILEKTRAVMLVGENGGQG